MEKRVVISLFCLCTIILFLSFTSSGFFDNFFTGKTTESLSDLTITELDVYREGSKVIIDYCIKNIGEDVSGNFYLKFFNLNNPQWGFGGAGFGSFIVNQEYCSTDIRSDVGTEGGNGYVLGDNFIELVVDYNEETLESDETNNKKTFNFYISGEEEITDIVYNCTDSDGGADIYTKGSITSSAPDPYEQSAIDSCQSSSIIEEFFCDDEGIIRFSGYECPSDHVCSDGACIEEEPELTETCVDNDPQNDLNVKGLCTDTDGYYYDKCVSEKVIEYSCNANNECYSQTAQSCSSGYICSDGKCIEETDLQSNNIKDQDRYEDKQVFLISDKNWKEVLPLVPLTTWTGNEEWCQRVYGAPNNVCAYPTLIYHDEDNAFDIDSIIYFIQQYSPIKVIIIGETPSELNNLLVASPELGAGLNIAQIERVYSENYLDYWENYGNVVYVEDNYELALLASTYASLINAPLIIEGTGLDIDSNFENRNVICIGNVNRNCNENYNLEQLQQKYVDLTNTDKIILVNPNDLNIKVEEESMEEEIFPPTPEKSTNRVSEFYSRSSLVAPILASAKYEIIISTDYVTYQEIDNFIEDEINNLNLNPSYLTIVSSPEAIPFARDDFDFKRDYLQEIFGTTPGGWTQVDGSLYGDLDGDYYQDIAVGRIFSLTLSDISSYISRSLFYNQLPKSDKFASLTSFSWQYASGYANNLMIDYIYSRLGLEKESTYVQYIESSDPVLFRDKSILAFDGHSGIQGGGSFDIWSLRNNRIWLSLPIVVSGGCLSCSYNKANINDNNPKSTLFCSEIIRRGAMAYVGATDTLSENTPVEYNFLRELTKNKDIGTAFKDASNIHFVDNSYKYSPFQTLLGDPTFNPGLNLERDIDTANLTQGSIINDGDKWIKSINIKLNETNTVSLENIRMTFNDNINMVTPPAYFGDNVFGSEIYYFKRYDLETDSIVLEESMGTLEIFFNFPENRDLELEKVSYAEMKIGDNLFDITDQLVYDKDNPFSKPIFSFNNKELTWIWLELNLNQGGNLVEQNTTHIPPIEINVDFEFKETGFFQKISLWFENLFG